MYIRAMLQVYVLAVHASSYIDDCIVSKLDVLELDINDILCIVASWDVGWTNTTVSLG